MRAHGPPAAASDPGVVPLGTVFTTSWFCVHAQARLLRLINASLPFDEPASMSGHRRAAAHQCRLVALPRGYQRAGICDGPACSSMPAHRRCRRAGIDAAASGTSRRLVETGAFMPACQSTSRHQRAAFSPWTSHQASHLSHAATQPRSHPAAFSGPADRRSQLFALKFAGSSRSRNIQN